MNYPFYFKVHIYIPEDNSYIDETGLGIAKSFTDAAHQIESYYGDELINIKHLELCESNNLIIIPEEYCENYVHSKF